MSHSLAILQQRYRLIVFVGIFFAVVAAVVVLVMPRSYRADAEVLIIAKNRYGVDPYTTVRSAERVGENVVQIMKTSDFLRKVRREEGYLIDWKSFDHAQEYKKRRLWEKTIHSSVILGTGVLSVSAYHPDPVQAKELAGAAIAALVNQGWQYVGSDVEMKVINEPVLTNWPVRPNIFLYTLGAFIIGVLSSAMIVVRRG